MSEYVFIANHAFGFNSEFSDIFSSNRLSDHTKFKDDVYFVKLDVDQLPDVSQELCIRAMPTFLFFKDGKRVDELVGANPAVLAQKVEKFAA